MKSQTTVVKLFNAQIESSSELQPVTRKGDTITYGPYEDAKPYKYSAMSLHFENNSVSAISHISQSTVMICIEWHLVFFSLLNSPSPALPGYHICY